MYNFLKRRKFHNLLNSNLSIIEPSYIKEGL